MERKYTYHFYIPVDNTGCGFYRLRVPSWAIMDQNRNNKVHNIFNECFIIPRDSYAFQAISSFRIQRWLDYSAKEYFDIIKTYRDKVGFKLIYDTDDLLKNGSIPKYNSFPMKKEIEDASTYYMNNCDYVTTSTEPLKSSLISHGVSESKIKVIPNRMPRWWGDHFDIYRTMRNYKNYKKRPRIGFVMGRNHFDSNNVTGDCNDDLYHILDWIIENRHKYQFVFMGGMNPKLKEYENDFEIHRGVPTLEFTIKRVSMNINLYIQPLQDNDFNRAKSNIKLLEAYGEGVPILTQDLPLYAMNKHCNFSTAEDLDKKVKAILTNKYDYSTIVERNYDLVQDWFIEDHLEPWKNILGAK